MRVHHSSYYAWVKAPESKRCKDDQRLLPLVKHYWLASGGHYGYRNIHLDLAEAGIKCGRDRTLRLMRLAQICAQRGYKRPKGYYSGKPDITAPNTLEGFLFLAVVMDLFARSIVGWSMSERMTDTLVQDALMAAYWRRKPEGTVRLHSDQGSQYSSRDFRTLLSSLNMEASMSRRGNCWDNAVAESFFGNLKKEKIRRHKYKTREEAKRAIFHYIEMFYNPKRRHTHNQRVSPMNYEKQYFMNQKSV